MKFKRMGVTATRKGLSEPQKIWLVKFLENNTAISLHHGDCIGGDNEVATLFAEYGTYIIAHPGNSGNRRANCTVNNRVYPPLENLVRNRVIVDSCDLLLGFPLSLDETERSGTWYTIRYAKKRKVRVIIVGPNGSEVDPFGLK